jgi:hypothetical protein
VDEQVVAAVLRSEVNGRLSADRIERLRGDRGEGGVLRIPRMIIPRLRVSKLREQENAKRRDNKQG